MDGVQLRQGCRTTMKGNYEWDNYKVIHVKDTCVFILTKVYLNYYLKSMLIKLCNKIMILSFFFSPYCTTS